MAFFNGLFDVIAAIKKPFISIKKPFITYSPMVLF
jgi:hypothetical protein